MTGVSGYARSLLQVQPPQLLSQGLRKQPRRGFRMKSRGEDFSPMIPMSESLRSLSRPVQKLLVAPGIATRSKDATRGAPGLTTSNKKLLLTLRDHQFRLCTQ